MSRRTFVNTQIFLQVMKFSYWGFNIIDVKFNSTFVKITNGIIWLILMLAKWVEGKFNWMNNWLIFNNSWIGRLVECVILINLGMSWNHANKTRETWP